ncbi:MAG: dTDP-4-dehydrorhamnose reductase [Acidobacteria bacterium]|nr:MAG: dTDP-4-dehydrorhamnose reductase [Acidobacteriota bacterium]
MTKERWLIVGGNGALGTDLVELLGSRAIPAFYSDFDISNKDQAFEFIKKQPITAIVNTAAYHHVPSCEEFPEEAFKVNAVGVRNLAEICSYLHLHLCHISTDYVFDGEKGSPYSEEDLPRPLNSYAVSKMAGEYMVQAYADSYSIVRSCGLYGKVPTVAKKGNFLTNILKQTQIKDELTIVNDEIVAPTYTMELARGIKALMEAEGKGVFHITQGGQTTWYDFAVLFLKQLDIDIPVKPVSRNQFQSSLNRPQYSILDCSKFQALTGADLLPWDEALCAYIEENGAHLKESCVYTRS